MSKRKLIAIIIGMLTIGSLVLLGLANLFETNKRQATARFYALTGRDSNEVAAHHQLRVQQAEAKKRGEQRESKLQMAYANREVFIGMTAAECQNSWGEPQQIHQTVTAYGKSEQWVYHGQGHEGYLYFDNGILTAIQD